MLEISSNRYLRPHSQIMSKMADGHRKKKKDSKECRVLKNTENASSAPTNERILTHLLFFSEHSDNNWPNNPTNIHDCEHDIIHTFILLIANVSRLFICMARLFVFLLLQKRK